LDGEDAEIRTIPVLVAQRIHDLKRDARLKYISVFKNHGANAGRNSNIPTRC